MCHGTFNISCAIRSLHNSDQITAVCGCLFYMAIFTGIIQGQFRMLHNVSIIIIIVVTGIDYITFYYNQIATFQCVQCSYNSRFCKIHAKFPYSERYTVLRRLQVF